MIDAKSPYFMVAVEIQQAREFLAAAQGALERKAPPAAFRSIGRAVESLLEAQDKLYLEGLKGKRW